MQKNIIIRSEPELVEETYKNIDKGIKLGKLHDKDNLSSLIRMLLRKFNRMADKW